MLNAKYVRVARFAAHKTPRRGEGTGHYAVSPSEFPHLNNLPLIRIRVGPLRLGPRKNPSLIQS